MKSLADRIKAARKHADLTQRELAQKVGVSQPVISQLEKGENLQSVHLLKIATVCGVRAEWLDTGKGSMTETDLSVRENTEGHGSGAAAKVIEMLSKHGKALTYTAQQRLLQAVSDSLAEDKAGNVITADFSRSARVKDGDILIPQYDVRASMGHVQVPAEYREFVRNLVVDKVNLDDLGLKYSDVRNLSIITGWGESMKGAIDDRSPVLIDHGVTDFIGEGVYVFTWLGHLFIKTVQLHDAESFKIVSKNKDFEPQTARMDDVHFHAKVLGAWNFTKM